MEPHITTASTVSAAPTVASITRARTMATSPKLYRSFSIPARGRTKQK